MKRWFSIFILLNLINFASAEGISDLLNAIDPSSALLLATFAISFSVLFFALNKFFKQNSAISAAVSGAISFLIVYQINQSGFSLENFFFDLGISENALLTIVPLIILAGFIFMLVKFKVNAFYLMGGILILFGFFFFGRLAQIMVIGFIFIIFGMLIIPIMKFLKISTGKERESSGNSTYTTSSTH